MDSELSRVDRATLRLWVLANASVWTFLAVLAGAVIHLGFVGFMRRPAVDLGPHVPYQFLATTGLSIIIGLAIGGTVGMRAWRWQPWLAALAAGAYVLVALVFFRRFLAWPTSVTTIIHPSDVGEGRSVSIGPAGPLLTTAYWGLFASITILVASVQAGRTARRRSPRLEVDPSAR